MAARKLPAAIENEAKAIGGVRVGIGGWNFEPWHTTFYPAGTSKKNELTYASRHVSAIEINSTYYRTQSPASYTRWHDETPDDFVFAVKASRFATNRRILGEAGDSIRYFLDSGLVELKAKLGPLLWQFMPTKKFEADDVAAFLALLPKEIHGLPLRHVLDVRHESFCCEAFVDLARAHDVAIVCSDSDDYPMIGDVTADFVYARLMRAQADEPTGYPAKELATWTERARAWAKGETITATIPIGKAAAKTKRDVFIFFINGAKERAPAGAMAMIGKLGT